MGEKEAKGFLGLVREYDSRLAEEVRARLADAPVEEFVVVEVIEDVPTEVRVVGRFLFGGLAIPENSGEEASTWAAVLSEDGQALTFVQRYEDGAAGVATVTVKTTYGAVVEDGLDQYLVHPLAFVTAARMLGLPYPGAEGKAAASCAVPVPGVGVLVVPGGDG
jgi:hypothetical protein